MRKGILNSSAALAALLLLAPAAGAQQGTSGGGVGGPTGVRLGTDGGTTGSGQHQGAGTRSTGIGSPSSAEDKQDFSTTRKTYKPWERQPIRGKPDRGGPIETQPLPAPTTEPGRPGAQPPPGTPRGR